MNPIDALSKITLLLFLGLIVSNISKKFKLPTTLMLILAGIILNNLYINGEPAFGFSGIFLLSASVMALSIVVFKGSSSFIFREMDTYSESSLKMFLLFMAFNSLILSAITHFIFKINILLSLLFAIVVSGVSALGILELFKEKTNKIIELLKLESILSTPFVVVMPFILLDIMQIDFTGDFFTNIYPFLQQVIIGIGTGIFTGLIVFKIMRHFYSEKISNITLLVSAMATYIIAELLNGEGVFAVAVFGVFFGKVTVLKKKEIHDFSQILSDILEIGVFVLVGFLIPPDINFKLIMYSLLLFAVMLILRFLSVHLVFMHNHLSLKEKIFMALNCGLGLPAAAVVFLLSNYFLNYPVIENGIKIISNVQFLEMPGADIVITIILFFIVYSSITSYIASSFSGFFIRKTE